MRYGFDWVPIKLRFAVFLLAVGLENHVV